MKSRHAMKLATPMLVLLAVALGKPAPAGEQDPLARLDEALKASAGFEYGKDAGPLERIERQVFEAVKDPERRQAVEGRLLQALGSATTRDAKEFLCRQLRTIGTGRSVPSLEPILTDPELSHMARHALERIEDPAAGAALLRALGKTSGKLQAGILGTLGRRSHEEALPAAAKLLGSQDADVARAAAAALGMIGGTGAVKALEAARPGAPERLRLEIDDALLSCAERFLERGQKAEAARIYETFHAPGMAKHLRIGALGGLVQARGAGAVALVCEAIKDPDREIRTSAIQLARTMKGQEAAKAFAGLFPSLPPDAQEILLSALDARAALAATKSEHEGVRAAAYERLGQIGDASHVDLLLEAAATAGGRVEQAARASLVQIKGGDIDSAILRSISSGDPRKRVEGIRALAARRATSAFAPLLRLAEDGEPFVRGEAIKALGALAGESRLGALVDLAVKPKDPADRPAVERAIAAAFQRVEDRDKQARPVLAALPGASAEARPVLLRLLGTTGAPAALQALRGALKDKDADARAEAVRAISEWPDPSIAEDLLQIARSLSDAAQKAVAFRGYVRMASLSKDPARLYARAMELADRPEDRKPLLGSLGEAGSKEALETIEGCLKDQDDQVQAAASLAAVQIADRIRKDDAPRARAAAEAALAAAKDPAIRKKAQDVIDELDKRLSYILSWLVSAPFQEKGKESRAIFDAVFPPESPEAKDVTWRRLRRGIGAWQIDLEAALGPQAHCAAYLRTSVWSPEEQDARLELGSDDAIKVWLNGKLVHANYISRGIAPGQDIAKVKLQKGWNDLLLKVVNHDGPWGACCRVRKPDGGVLDGLKVEARRDGP